jgi:hypothetical protein
MAKPYESRWWSVDLPPGWTASTGGECATFRATPPLGVLQISSARKNSASIQDDDLKEFANERLDRDVQLSVVAFGPFSGFTSEREEKSLFWKEWWLRSGQVMLYVTYNVRSKYKRSEMDAVEAILRNARAK